MVLQIFRQRTCSHSCIFTLLYSSVAYLQHRNISPPACFGSIQDTLSMPLFTWQLISLLKKRARHCGGLKKNREERARHCGEKQRKTKSAPLRRFKKEKNKSLPLFPFSLPHHSSRDGVLPIPHSSTSAGFFLC